MNQSSVIFFFLFAAYFVFITVRGELPIYMGFLLSKAPAKTPVADSSGATKSDTASVVEGATKAAQIAAVVL